MVLSSAQIALMRTAASAVYPDTGTITRASRVTDGEGGMIATYATVTTASCWLDPTGKAAEILQVYAERIGERQATTINFPAGTDVQEGDRVTIGGVTWEVLGILSGSVEINRVCAVVRQG